MPENVSKANSLEIEVNTNKKAGKGKGDVKCKQARNQVEVARQCLICLINKATFSRYGCTDICNPCKCFYERNRNCDIQEVGDCINMAEKTGNECKIIRDCRRCRVMRCIQQNMVFSQLNITNREEPIKQINPIKPMNQSEHTMSLDRGMNASKKAKRKLHVPNQDDYEDINQSRSHDADQYNEEYTRKKRTRNCEQSELLHLQNLGRNSIKSEQSSNDKSSKVAKSMKENTESTRLTQKHNTVENANGSLTNQVAEEINKNIQTEKGIGLSRMQKQELSQILTDTQQQVEILNPADITQFKKHLEQLPADIQSTAYQATTIAGMERESEKMIIKSEDLSRTPEKSRKEIDELRSSIETSQNSVKDQASDITNLKTENINVKREIEKIMEMMKEHKDEYSTTVDKLKNLSREMEREIKEVSKQDLQNIENEVTSMKQEMITRETDFRQLEQDHYSLKEELLTKERLLADLDNLKTQFQEQINQLKEDVSENAQLKTKNQELEREVIELKKLLCDLEEVKEDFEKIKSENKLLLSRIEQINSNNEQSQNYLLLRLHSHLESNEFDTATSICCILIDKNNNEDLSDKLNKIQKLKKDMTDLKSVLRGNDMDSMISQCMHFFQKHEGYAFVAMNELTNCINYFYSKKKYAFISNLIRVILERNIKNSWLLFMYARTCQSRKRFREARKYYLESLMLNDCDLSDIYKAAIESLDEEYRSDKLSILNLTEPLSKSSIIEAYAHVVSIHHHDKHVTHNSYVKDFTQEVLIYSNRIYKELCSAMAM